MEAPNNKESQTTIAPASGSRVSFLRHCISHAHSIIIALLALYLARLFGLGAVALSIFLYIAIWLGVRWFASSVSETNQKIVKRSIAGFTVIGLILTFFFTVNYGMFFVYAALELHRRGRMLYVGFTATKTLALIASVVLYAGVLFTVHQAHVILDTMFATLGLHFMSQMFNVFPSHYLPSHPGILF